MGLLDGVTTNPSLVSKTGKSFKTVISEILEVVKGPINLEVVSTKSQEMIEEAKNLSKIAKNIVVKIPMIPEGMKAVSTLSREGIKTNVTLVFSPTQALLAAKAGANYISPFIGRLDDISQTGMDLIHQIQTIIKNYNFKSEIIVASVRNPLHVVDAAMIGADIATVPFNVMEQLFKHPLTDIGLEKFLNDWKKVPNN